MNKKLFSLSLLTGILLIVITDRSTKFIHQGVFSKYEESLLEPLFFLSLAIASSTFILLFFSDRIFSLWMRRFMIWFAPIVFILIALNFGGNSLVSPSRTDLAILFGEIMVVVTLVFSLLARFFFKVK